MHKFYAPQANEA